MILVTIMSGNIAHLKYVILALFRTYQAQLARLDAKVATRNDLIAVEDAALRDVFSTKVNLNKRGDAFFLGRRVEVLELDRGETRPIMAHMALAEGESYPYVSTRANMPDVF